MSMKKKKLYNNVANIKIIENETIQCHCNKVSAQNIKFVCKILSTICSETPLRS